MNFSTPWLAVQVLSLFVLVFVPLQADYAYLDPAPDAVIWEEGDETPVWLQTNRASVDLRIDSVSLGVGDVRRVFPESGASVVLGRGEGCLDWAVQSLEIYSVVDSGAGKEVSAQGTIDRNGTTGAVDVHLRGYFRDDGVGAALAGAETVGAGSNSFSTAFNTNATGVYVVEASHSERFPEASTRMATVDVTDLDTAVGDSDVGAVRMSQDGGIGLVACTEDNDVAVTLHGDDGEELNRYLVDIHRDPPKRPVVPPQSTEPYITMRVCVDAANSRENYLDGGEYVGDALDATDFGLAGSILDAFLSEASPGNTYLYFFASEITGGDVQLSITDAGAGDTLGLDADRVYPVQVTATTDNGTPYDANYAGIDVDGNPVQDADDEALVGPATSDDETMTIAVGVWLDTATLSPNDDGRCS